MAVDPTDSNRLYLVYYDTATNPYDPNGFPTLDPDVNIYLRVLTRVAGPTPVWQVGDRILVADDDRGILHTCSKILKHAGYEVTTAPDGNEALGLLKSSHYDLLLVDLKMPGLSGLETVTLARKIDPTLMIVMLTAYATIQTAVDAVKRGAFDYLAKPFTVDQLRAVVEQSLQQKQLLEESLAMREQLATDLGFDKIIGISEAMQKLFITLQKVVRTNTNILVQGETGTGKDLVARTIHAHSFRREKPFLAVDCAALPENLLESEVFGHEKGAFTGAHQLKRGKIESAQGGTVFLDEIGDISAEIQTKLLRFLQEREFERVGGIEPIRVDVRIIAATNRDLESAVSEGRFRNDLYYRLNVVPIMLPPLRERKEDIADLTKFFAARFSKEAKKATAGISDEAMEKLMAYDWPGNVRELANIIERAVVLGHGATIQLEDIAPAILAAESKAQSLTSYHDAIDGYRREVILQALAQTHGNRAAAARLLGLERSYLLRLMKSFQIT